MKKNILWGVLLFTTAILGFTSCSDDDDNDNTNAYDVIDDSPESIVKAQYGAYILDQGRITYNNASLVFRDLQTNRSYEAFKAANGIDLGDVAQDIIVYGNKMYIAVYNSGIIYVTDKNAKILGSIKDDTNKLQPRSLDSYNGKVYVTLYDGYLARIDTTSMAIDKKIAVGPNPEGVKAVNNKIYVANSGGMNWQNGYNNTVSVVDPELTTEKTITVVTNPTKLEVDKYNNLYLVSTGDYSPNIPYSLQQINTTDDSVTELRTGDVSSIYAYGDKLYILNKKYGDNYVLLSSTFFYYDIPNKKFVDESFITDGATINDISSLAINPTSNEFYVTAANGANNGDIYVFSSAGKLTSKFDSGSPYPTKVCFVKK